MKNSTMFNAEISPEEKFKRWKDSYLSSPILPPEHRDFIAKWSNLFDKFPNDSYFKTALYGILVENLAGAWGVSQSLENLQRLLPVAERLIASDCFEDALAFFSFFWKYNADCIDQSTQNKQMSQTKAARQARKDWNKMRGELKALWDYLKLVEQKLHPEPPEGENHPIRSATNESDAVRRVFRDNKEAIMALLPDYQEEADAKKEFAKAFRVYTAAFLECNGKTVTGYVPEKRAPRSEKSKEKMRNTAIKKWQEKQ